MTVQFLLSLFFLLFIAVDSSYVICLRLEKVNIFQYDVLYASTCRGIERPVLAYVNDSTATRSVSRIICLFTFALPAIHSKSRSLFILPRPELKTIALVHSMATTTAKSKTKAYPRATLRKILKGHSRKNIGRTTDALVFLDYVLFMEELMKNATHKAQEDGDKKGKIAPKDIRKVTLVSALGAVGIGTMRS